MSVCFTLEIENNTHDYNLYLQIDGTNHYSRHVIEISDEGDLSVMSGPTAIGRTQAI
jgi:hypothetical protein